MEFEDLEIFQTVAQKGTITEAAKTLNYVQSNITSRIKKLETEMNTPLFNRFNRGMTLTPEGKKLLVYCEEILSQVNEMKKAVQSKTQPSGTLDIASVESVVNLPAILSAFNHKYKHVDLSLFTGVTEQLQWDVLNHQLDGAFVTETDPHPDLVTHDVFQEELVIVSDNTTTSFEQLKQKPLLCFSEGCGYRKRLQAWYEDQGITPKKIMEFGTLQTILRSVIVGLGVTIVPKSAISELEAKGLIKSHELPETYSQIKTVFIRRKDTFLTTTLEKFIETIEQKKDEPAEPMVF